MSGNYLKRLAKVKKGFFQAVRRAGQLSPSRLNPAGTPSLIVGMRHFSHVPPVDFAARTEALGDRD